METLPASAPPKHGGLLRPLVHAGMGLFLFALPYLEWWQAAGCAVLALLHNRYLLARYAPRLFREGESGWKSGVVRYPLGVLIIILGAATAQGAEWDFGEYYHQLAMPLWAIYAIGDPVAALCGRWFGRHPLGWNPQKSWAGFAGYCIASGLAAGALVAWFERRGSAFEEGVNWFLLYGVAGIVSIAALSAFIESLDIGLDDNLSVPLSMALLIPFVSGFVQLAGLVKPATLDWLRNAWCGTGLEMEARWYIFATYGPREAMLAAGVGIPLMVVALAMKKITPAGGMVGVLMCAFIGFGFSAWGILPMAAFFFLSVAATRFGFARKQERGIEQERGGMRGIPHVLANGGAAIVVALWAPSQDRMGSAVVVLAAIFATAAWDTVSSEVGKTVGKRTFTLLPFRSVAPGTKGAVSLEGSIAGFVAAALVALSALPALWLTGTYRDMQQLIDDLGMRIAQPPGLGLLVAAAMAGAFVGTTFESIAGARLGPGNKAQQGHFFNFLNTLVGAFTALVICRFF